MYGLKQFTVSIVAGENVDVVVVRSFCSVSGSLDLLYDFQC